MKCKPSNSCKELRRILFHVINLITDYLKLLIMKCKFKLPFTKVTSRVSGNKITVTVSKIYSFIGNYYPGYHVDNGFDEFRYAVIYFLTVLKMYPEVNIKLHLKIVYDPDNYSILHGKKAILYEKWINDLKYSFDNDEFMIYDYGKLMNELTDEFKTNPPIIL